MQIGQRVAVVGMAVSGTLAVIKITAGLFGHSTAVLADGLESASDVLASGIVLLGLTLAAKPADADHPYGHGRAETLAGLIIGLALTAGGTLISSLSIERLGTSQPAVELFVVWPLVLSVIAKSALAFYKFGYGRKLQSDALTADAWNDGVDTLSALAALTAVALSLSDPGRFRDADRYGGFVVGLIVVTVGVRVAWSTSRQLMDTMPDERLMD